MSKFTPAYQAHVKEIKKAQKEFDNNPNRETATKLSNLKNNMFKDPTEIFTQAYITRQLNKAEAQIEDCQLHIVYEEGPFNPFAKRLRVTTY